MAGRKIIIAVIFLIIASSLLLFTYHGKKEGKEIKVEMEITPKQISLYESESTQIILKLYVNDMPHVARINWSIESHGDTGKLIFENESMTNKDGVLFAKYFAPNDVDEMNYSIKIIAKVKISGKEYEAICNITIHPKLYQTALKIESNKKEMIAGETCFLKAYLFVNVGSWVPLANKTIEWKFIVGNDTIIKKTKTNAQGIAKIPFFYSNALENITAIIEANFPRNLSGDIDYDGSKANLTLKIIPEKPGDFPVVLIHGWVGSISDALLNFTWYNLTQKLIANGFKVLDFDITKPGIQWLTYEPNWGEHHIPWIAAKVCDKIKEALILNGYPPNQTIDIVAHSMGGLVARFMAEHYMADVDYWNDNWNGTGYPWYGDGDPDITIGPYQIDDLIVVGTPCHGVPPNINETLLKTIIKYAFFPWWMAQVPDMIYNSPFLQAMGYKTIDLIDYYAVGGDIGIGEEVDFDGDGIPHRSDGLCPTESPYLEGRPLFILVGAAWPAGEEDHLSLIGINDTVHQYIMKHLIN